MSEFVIFRASAGKQENVGQIN